MKITNVTSTKGGARARRKASPSGPAFADRLRETSESEESAPVRQSAQVDGVESLLAVQEVEDALEEKTRKAKARRYGDDLLERLQRLQDDLLRGRISKEDLATLAQKIRQGRVHVTDPRLNEILDEIELRAEVEVAKWSRWGRTGGA
ncbi:flagellar assembly protein FliX [Varunaivibrio sulfuroxidans]|uniref:Class II flagellar assembly regulator n=1 Tax=Varunaivibrio sulfuroxidans TaxID=1773489 RepID=A0A4V6NYI9_9PROT|nr:flagellar assembly protein FliX [Varunaivibrio sulfuroxidans]TCS63011.1 class II flagellar assembly regulator [Varunaivibrio sulfuroxidans]WES31912.1 flagellar assembly protein FliX [Varunaivibrio sulfuroxidans]